MASKAERGAPGGIIVATALTTLVGERVSAVFARTPPRDHAVINTRLISAAIVRQGIEAGRTR